MAKRMSGREAALLRMLRKSAAYKQHGLCWWCEQPMVMQVTDHRDPRACTAEHLIPVHAGGQTTAANIVAACRKCNNERHWEFNSIGKGVVASAGDDAAVYSPFAVLGQRGSCA